MGNDMMTRYAYDPLTYRLLRIRTEKYEEDDHVYEPQSGTTKQDSGYEYDLGGNIVKIKERVTDCGINGSLLGVDGSCSNPSPRSLPPQEKPVEHGFQRP